MMEWMKTIYGAVGAQWPALSLVIATLTGAFLFGAGWWVVGRAYQKEQATVAAAEQRIPIGSPASEPNTRENMNPNPKSDVQAGANSAISVGQQGGVTNSGTINMHVNTMQPRVEGVRVSMQQVASPREDAPYAIQIVVQVASPVQPFGVAVVCSKDVVEGKFSVVGSSTYQQVATGYLNHAPSKSYFVTFASPAVTPSSPLVVTVMCREPFEVLSVERMMP